MTPTIGLFGISAHAGTKPAAMADIAALAEDLGYDSLWAPDHVVLPDPRVAPSPMEPGEPILDPVVALGHLAARTDRILLGTGIVILPQRNPVVLAKQLASVDVLSAGRLIFGMGVGYLEPELSAVGIPMADRSARAMEHLAAMRALWHDRRPAFHGRYADFEGVDAHPRPVQQPVPVVMGGHSAAAHRRALASADGWYGFMLDQAGTAAQLESLRAAGHGSVRDLHISVSPAQRLDPAAVGAYGELGVDRLIVVPRPNLPPADLRRFVERNAPDRLGARRH